MLSRLYLKICPEAFLVVNLGPGIQCVLVVAFLTSLHIHNTSCSNYYMMQVALDPFCCTGIDHECKRPQQTAYTKDTQGHAFA